MNKNDIARLQLPQQLDNALCINMGAVGEIAHLTAHIQCGAPIHLLQPSHKAGCR